MTSIIDTGTAHPEQHLSDDIKQRIAKFNRKALYRLYIIARNRAYAPGAYFWRELKTECWRRLAGAK